nr:four helix bundle protein [Chryseobacterium sp. PCH239]
MVEGYGRSTYRNDYIRFLIYSHASNDETINHLEKIMILYPNFSLEFETLRNEYNTLGGKINIYKKWVIENWNKNNLQQKNKSPSQNHATQKPESRIPKPETQL